MVTPPINSMQAFDTYYGGNNQNPKPESSEINTVHVILIAGVAIASACAVYYAISHNNLKKKMTQGTENNYN